MQYIKFYNYDVYENGDIYSHFRDKFLNGEITKYGYKQITLFINGKIFRTRVHRLVACLFLDRPQNYKEMVVNHKDGNKLNNHYLNLEWCTYDYNNYHARINKLNNVSQSNSKRWNNEEFRNKTAKNISNGMIKSGCSKWKNNPRFRYEIFDKQGTEYNRNTLAKKINLSQSYTDKLMKDFVNGITNSYFEKYGIYVKDLKQG